MLSKESNQAEKDEDDDDKNSSHEDKDEEEQTMCQGQLADNQSSFSGGISPHPGRPKGRPHLFPFQQQVPGLCPSGSGLQRRKFEISEFWTTEPLTCFIIYGHLSKSSSWCCASI